MFYCFKFINVLYITLRSWCFWPRPKVPKFFLTYSNFFCIIVSRKKGFVLGTFGLGKTHQECTVTNKLQNSTSGSSIVRGVFWLLPIGEFDRHPFTINKRRCDLRCCGTTIDSVGGRFSTARQRALPNEDTISRIGTFSIPLSGCARSSDNKTSNNLSHKL